REAAAALRALGRGPAEDHGLRRAAALPARAADPPRAARRRERRTRRAAHREPRRRGAVHRRRRLRRTAARRPGPPGAHRTRAHADRVRGRPRRPPRVPGGGPRRASDVPGAHRGALSGVRRGVRSGARRGYRDPMSLKLGVVCYPTVGGSGVVATEIATHAARSGHEVHLLSYERPARLRGAVPGLRFHAVDVSAYPLFRYPPYDLALATRMLDVQEEADLDLFHVHYAIPHAISAFLAQSMGRRELRWITTLHGTDITVVGADRAYMRPTRFALDASTAVTAVSQFLADETMLLFGTRSGIEVIPNFVDVGCFAATAPERFYDRADEERIAVHVSNLRPVKRVADVVR